MLANDGAGPGEDSRSSALCPELRLAVDRSYSHDWYKVALRTRGMAGLMEMGLTLQGSQVYYSFLYKVLIN